MEEVGTYLRERAEYSLARPLYERALAIREKALGPEHRDTASSLNSLALLLGDQRRAGRCAAALSERALAIREEVLGPEHPYFYPEIIRFFRIVEFVKSNSPRGKIGFE